MTIYDMQDNTNKYNKFLLSIGGRLEKVAKGHAEIVLPLKEMHQNMNGSGAVHGGVLLTIIDAACGAACRTMGGTLVTVECKTNFLKGVKTQGQTIRAVGDVIHNGRKLKVCEIKVYDGDNVACISTATMCVVSPEPVMEYED